MQMLVTNFLYHCCNLRSQGRNNLEVAFYNLNYEIIADHSSGNVTVHININTVSSFKLINLTLLNY
jgi:hypothetical protein